MANCSNFSDSTSKPSCLSISFMSSIHFAKALHAIANFSKSCSPIISCIKPPLRGSDLFNSASNAPASEAALTASESILPLIVSEKSTTALPNVFKFCPMEEKSTDPPNFSVNVDKNSDTVNAKIILAVFVTASTAVESIPLIVSKNAFAYVPNIHNSTPSFANED